MDKEFMSQMHMLNKDLHRELTSYIGSKRQEAYLDNTPEGIVKQNFWRYIRSCLDHTSHNPHFLTYFHHSYCASRTMSEQDIAPESKKVLDDVLLPAPKHINKGLLDGASYWDYSDKCDESDEIKNWGG